MLKALRKLDRRLGLLVGLLAVLAFAAPAFEAHACPAEAVPTVAVADAADDGAPACPDCGPSCANGCCHRFVANANSAKAALCNRMI